MVLEITGITLGGIFIIISIQQGIRYFDHLSGGGYDPALALKNDLKSIEIFIDIVAEINILHNNTILSELIESNFLKDASLLFDDPDSTYIKFKRVFNSRKKNSIDIFQSAKKLRRRLKNKDDTISLFTILVFFIFIGEKPTDIEKNTIEQIADIFGIEKDFLNYLFSAFEQFHTVDYLSTIPLEKAYTLLGTTVDDSMAIIKKKYMKLVKKYHPDLLNTQNISDEEMKRATEKMAEINAAYELIKQEKKETVQSFVSRDR